VPAPAKAGRDDEGKPRGSPKKEARDGTMEITEISRLQDLLFLFAKPDGGRTKPAAAGGPGQGQRRHG